MNELQPAQEGRVVKYDPELLEIAKTTVFPNSTDAELKFFLHKCDSCGVDPLSLMLYPYKDKHGKVSFLTSIDLLRSRAETSNVYDGQDEIIYEYRDNNPVPFSAKATVYRKDISRPFVCKVLFSEFKLNKFIWQNKPHVMIAKCAEAQALRKAFPQRLDKLYIVEEMGEFDPKGSSKPKVKFEIEDEPEKIIPIQKTGEIKVEIKEPEKLKPLTPEEIVKKCEVAIIEEEKKEIDMTKKGIYPFQGDDKKVWIVSAKGTQRVGPTEEEREKNKYISAKQFGLLIGELKRNNISEKDLCDYLDVVSIFFITWDKRKKNHFEEIVELVKTKPETFWHGECDKEIVDSIKETFGGEKN